MTSLREIMMSEYSDAYKAWSGIRPRGSAYTSALALNPHALNDEINKLNGWALEDANIAEENDDLDWLDAKYAEEAYWEQFTGKFLTADEWEAF